MAMIDKVLKYSMEMDLNGEPPAWRCLPITKDEAKQVAKEMKGLYGAPNIDENNPWKTMLGFKLFGVRLIPIEGENLSLVE